MAHEAEELFHPLLSNCTIASLQQHGDVHLMIAPHPDDDVIGAGGTMALLSTEGRPVVSLYATDGSAPQQRVRQISRVRQTEALDALRAVAAYGAFFLPFSSKQLAADSRAAVAALGTVIRCIAPRAIYLPCPFERHPTHQAVTAMALRVLRQLKMDEVELWGYSVWSTLPLGVMVRTVDISSVAKLKGYAISQHKSQTALQDYAEGALGRNRSEAVFHDIDNQGSMEYVERFLDMRPLLHNRRLTLLNFCKQVVVQSIAL